MRISKTLLILVALPIAALHWIQTHPDVEQKIKTALSRENLLEPKYKSATQQAENERNKTPLIPQASNSNK